MTIFNKYYQSQLWLEKAKNREVKKELVKVPVQFPDIQPISNIAYLNQTQVVFTKDDKGYNLEETNKIQQIYAELSDLPWLPVLANS